MCVMTSIYSYFYLPVMIHCDCSITEYSLLGNSLSFQGFIVAGYCHSGRMKMILMCPKPESNHNVSCCSIYGLWLKTCENII